MTLLQIVDSVLNDMDGDEITSITDTTESKQVASIAEDVYFALLAEHRIPAVRGLFALTVTDANTPAAMQIPATANSVDWIMFDARTAEGASDAKTWVDVPFKEPEVFIAQVMARSDQDDNVDEMSDATITGGVPLLVLNDRAPRMYTSFDDDYLIFDAYDSDIDTFLPAAKTLAYGIKEPTFTQSDSFTPDLDSSLFPLYLAEVKIHCMNKLGEKQDFKDEQLSKRLRNARPGRQRRAAVLERRVDFGRAARKLR